MGLALLMSLLSAVLNVTVCLQALLSQINATFTQSIGLAEADLNRQQVRWQFIVCSAVIQLGRDGNMSHVLAMCSFVGNTTLHLLVQWNLLRLPQNLRLF